MSPATSAPQAAAALALSYTSPVAPASYGDSSPSSPLVPILLPPSLLTPPPRAATTPATTPASRADVALQLAAFAHYATHATQQAIYLWRAWQGRDATLHARAEAGSHFFPLQRGWWRMRHWPEQQQRRLQEREQLLVHLEMAAAHGYSYTRRRALTALRLSSVALRRFTDAKLAALVRVASLRALAAIASWSAEAVWRGEIAQAAVQLGERRLAMAHEQWRRAHVLSQYRAEAADGISKRLQACLAGGPAELLRLVGVWRRAAARNRLLTSGAVVAQRAHTLSRAWRRIVRATRHAALPADWAWMRLNLAVLLRRWVRVAQSVREDAAVIEQASHVAARRWMRQWRLRVARAAELGTLAEETLRSREASQCRGGFLQWKATCHRRQSVESASDAASDALRNMLARRSWQRWHVMAASEARLDLARSYSRRFSLQVGFDRWREASARRLQLHPEHIRAAARRDACRCAHRQWALFAAAARVRGALSERAECHLGRQVCARWRHLTAFSRLDARRISAKSVAVEASCAARRRRFAIARWWQFRCRCLRIAIATARLAGWKRLVRSIGAITAAAASVRLARIYCRTSLAARAVRQWCIWKAAKEQRSLSEGARLLSCAEHVRTRSADRLRRRGMLWLRHACMCSHREVRLWRRWVRAVESQRAFKVRRAISIFACTRRAFLAWQCSVLADVLESAARASRIRELHEQLEATNFDEQTDTAPGTPDYRAAVDAVAATIGMRRGLSVWRAHMSARARAEMERASCQQRRLALHLAIWARWWWLRLFLPSLARLSSLRLAVACWLEFRRSIYRDDAARMSTAVQVHLIGACRRGFRAFLKHQLLVHARRAAALEHAELSRLASAAESLERWRRPRRLEEERRSLALHFYQTGLVSQWRQFVRLDVVRTRVARWWHRRLLRLTWGGWRLFCTLPLRYERLLTARAEAARSGRGGGGSSVSASQATPAGRRRGWKPVA